MTIKWEATKNGNQVNRRFSKILSLLLIMTGFVIASSCNSKEEATEEYISTESVAVTAFSLNPNISIMKNLDSVFFSIDLNHGVIFNADSLPKGTKINKLIAKISYPSTVTGAQITMSGGTTREGVIDYFRSPSDTIDFTGRVTLELKAGDITKTYLIKVNVHQVESDTLIWENLSQTSTLPSRMSSPKNQKTVMEGETVYSVIQENDGSYTLASSSDLFAGHWTKEEIRFGFTPQVNTFTSTATGFYILDTSGKLYSSVDAKNWQDCGKTWKNVIGAYESYVLGIAESAAGTMMSSYPEGLAETALPTGFPVEGYSAPVVSKSAWATSSTIMIFGGKAIDGTFSDGAWAYDGTRWANLADRPLPAMYGVSVIPYYTYMTAATGGERELSILLALGGLTADGEINRDVYISYNNGLSWTKGPADLRLPSSMEIGHSADALTVGKQMESNLSDAWKSIKPHGASRIKYDVEGDLLKWECPYIFIFGGYDTRNALLSNVKCGVLRRLTFAPLF